MLSFPVPGCLYHTAKICLCLTDCWDQTSEDSLQMSNPPLLVAAVGRDLEGMAQRSWGGQGCGGCPQRGTFGEWHAGSGCSGGISGWMLGLALAGLNPLHGQGRGMEMPWVLKNHPLCTLICCRFLHGAVPYLLWHPRK